jgi:poly(3-hydroxybutyrate) depolymerase
MNCRSFLVPIFVVLLAIAGFTQTTQTISFKVAGVTRSFVAHIPSGISKPALVFFVHGYGGSGSSFESDTKADKVADREKFIAVYPSAISGSWAMNDTTDYSFLLAIIDTVDARYHIDRNRVYCTGFSQGGFISFGLGYKYPNIFAAVAPVSGHIPSFATSKTIKRTVPMFLTFGTSDVSTVATFMADITTWLKFDTCPATKTVTRPYPSTNAKSVITRVTYSCANGTSVVYDSVVGGPHEWAMDTVTKVNTSEEVWAFFKKYSLPTTTAVYRQTASVVRESVSASYSSGIVRLCGVSENSRVRVFDTKGRLAARATVAQQQFTFKDKPSGVYMLMVSGSDAAVAIKMVIP